MLMNKLLPLIISIKIILKHDRVSTIDCDEFYYSDKYDNIKLSDKNKQDILLLGCKFFESVFIDVGGLVTQKQSAWINSQGWF